MAFAGTESRLYTLTVRLPEVPPPGDGFDTVINAEPICVTSDASTVAFNCVAFTIDVGRAVPFQLTTDAELKPVPLTVSEVEADPVATRLGERLEIAGTGAYSPPVTVVVDVTRLLAGEGSNICESTDAET